MAVRKKTVTRKPTIKIKHRPQLGSSPFQTGLYTEIREWFKDRKEPFEVHDMMEVFQINDKQAGNALQNLFRKNEVKRLVRTGVSPNSSRISYIYSALDNPGEPWIDYEQAAALRKQKQQDSRSKAPAKTGKEALDIRNTIIHLSRQLLEMQEKLAELEDIITPFLDKYTDLSERMALASRAFAMPEPEQQPDQED